MNFIADEAKLKHDPTAILLIEAIQDLKIDV